MTISIKDAIDYFESNTKYLSHNHDLMKMLEGEIKTFVLESLREQLSADQFAQIRHRINLVNLLPRYVDKLTNIYQTTVTREVIGGTQADQDLMAWYVEKFQLNHFMNKANEVYNLCKSVLIYPYAHQGKPCLRLMLNDRAIPYSSDQIDPSRPTDVIVLAEKENHKKIFWVYSENEFKIIDSDENVLTSRMRDLDNEEGINPFAPVLPFVYAADSRFSLVPKIDEDVIPMMVLVPCMLSDLNLAALFQAFSILYGIDLDDENMAIGPGKFLRFKSDPTTQTKPELGSIKPTVDFGEVLSLIQSELSLWLQSKGIRPGSVGQLTSENFMSGISKLVDEMDTFEARQKQTEVFAKLEMDLWDLIINTMHPYWVENQMIDNRQSWSFGVKVKTKFSVQLPAQSRGQFVRDTREEFAAGFISRKSALKRLNPEKSDTEIDDMILEIDEERGLSEPLTTVDGDQNDGMATV